MKPYYKTPRQMIRMSVPNHIEWPSLKKLQQNIINFPYTSYPFPNHSVKADLFSTMVRCSLSQDKIERILSFKCKNIINVKNIHKVESKQKPHLKVGNNMQNKNSISSFCFYYEKVQYSLEYILESKNQYHMTKMPKFQFDRAQIKKTLANVMAYLFKEGIFAFVKFSHIGVDQNGHLKVYIAPNVLFDQDQYNPKTRILIIKYLNDVLRQIDSKFAKTLTSKNSIENLKLQQLSLNNQIIENQQSFIIDRSTDQKQKNKNEKSKLKNQTNPFQNLEKSLNDQQQNFIGSSGSTNLIHLKLQDQMKRRIESHKFAQQAENYIKDQKKSQIFSKQEQKKKINQISLQIEQIRKKIRQKADQKRDKNLFITKGYRTLATQALTNENQFIGGYQKYQKMIQNDQKHNLILQIPHQNLNKIKKRKSSQSSINFRQRLKPQHQYKLNGNLNVMNSYQKNDHQNQSFYAGGQDCMSIDTYEMQIGQHYEMPKMHLGGDMRKTLIPNKSRDFIQGKKRPLENQKNCMPRFYESAGGKRFSHIVNLLKPQFQPKKSNIFQEPQKQNQSESKHSVSLKKSLGSKYSDKQSIQKRRKVKSKLSSSDNNLQKQVKGLKSLQQFKNQLKNIMSNKQKAFGLQGDANRIQIQRQRQKHKNPQVESFYQQKTQKPRSSDKYCEMFRNKLTLDQKVRNAMEKTKKAIEVLNKAKSRQGIFPYFKSQF